MDIRTQSHLPEQSNPAPASAYRTAYVLDCDEVFVDQVRGLLHGLEIATVGASDLSAFQTAAENDPPALVIVDLNSVSEDGLQICRTLRHAPATQNAVLILASATDHEETRIAGLEAGADYVIGKPLCAREFIARVKSLLRNTESIPTKEILRCGPLALDPNTMIATSSGEAVELTYTEFKILEFLMENTNSTVSRAALCAAVQRPGHDIHERAIDVYICRLRAKLEMDPHRPAILRNQRGRGYMLVAPTNL